MPLFSVKLTPSRTDFVSTITEEERAIVSAHFQYYSDLLAKKKLIFAGRCHNGHYGIAFLNTTEIDEANKLITNDPAIQQNVFCYTIDEFSIALLDAQELSSNYA